MTLPGGSAVEEIGYGSFQPARESGRWRKVALTAAGLAVASALVAAAAMAPVGQRPAMEELSESKALSMANAYFGGADRKAEAHSRVAAKTTELASHSAAASMKALDQALSNRGAIHNVFDPKPAVVAPPKPALAAAPKAVAAAAAAPKVQKPAVVKPAVVVHHAAEEVKTDSPLAKLNHGHMFMGSMFKDHTVQGSEGDRKAAPSKPVGDDRIVAARAAKAVGQQSLALVKKGAGVGKDAGVPRVIAKADRNIVEDPFHDKKV
eukprot:CAMPEP_0173384540 /NCGR_PEP_ID=MMETSP1356-20130122/7111_1 /TAXON_ID=77927 ORGANISM="Hemiselmis virescens, Strain PCC157" /NCGR_SAMPLE_ID=MMETSP1356 /ASSEMBLY_ACC=CAM_ASM_000847 /LENGTH=263 /DNA_ID=CAMNT_0014339939 /DNA_START=13 /DNA_END=801 /DNA_ORIENTATION=-